MLAEHIFYSAALAIIVGMLCLRYPWRDFSWIIIILAWAPDTDYFIYYFLRFFRIRFRFDGLTFIHGTFHNVAVMIVFAVIFAFILHKFGLRYLDAFVMSIIGFGAHLVEDALVYPHGYALLWPFLKENVGLGWLATSANEDMYNANFFHIANTQVLLIGLVLLLIAILIRTRFRDPGASVSPAGSVYQRYFGKKNDS